MAAVKDDCMIVENASSFFELMLTLIILFMYSCFNHVYIRTNYVPHN